MADRLARGFTRPGTRFGAIPLALGVSVAVGAPAAAPAGTDGQALLIAAQRGDLASVVTLLDGGVDPDTPDAVNNTALIFAARDGHPDIVRALIGGGATVNWTDAEGVTHAFLPRSGVIRTSSRSSSNMGPTRGDPGPGGPHGPRLRAEAGSGG